MNINETNPDCCWFFQRNYLTNEESFDNNDNDILLFNKDNPNNNKLPKTMLIFYSNRIELGNNHFLVHKISNDGTIVLTLTYLNNNNK